MLYVALATEDELSEAVGKRLLSEIAHPTEANLYLRRNGFGYLRAKMKNWCELAVVQPVVLLTDLDRHSCPSSLMEDWFGESPRPTQLIFRVAVREIESWLLADHEAIRRLMGQKGKLPSKPDSLDDPKRYLLKGNGEEASQGIGYNARLTDMVINSWDPARAAKRSPSLHQARFRLHELGQRFSDNAIQ